jgi:hypothetical protein
MITKDSFFKTKKKFFFNVLKNDKFELNVYESRKAKEEGERDMINQNIR